MSTIDSAKQRFLTQFDHWRQQGSTGSGALHDLRVAARAQLEVENFPTLKNEDWKYTSLKSFLDESFQFAPEAQVTKGRLKDRYQIFENGYRIVFINGRFQPRLSKLRNLPAGATIQAISQISDDQRNQFQQTLAATGRTADDIFSQLATAFLNDGVFIHLTHGVKLGQPVQLLYLSQSNPDPYFTAPRNVILLDADAEATVVEHFQGEDDAIYHSNPLTQIQLNENAHLDHYKLGLESGRAFHVGRIIVNQARGSHLRNWSLTFGGQLVRNEIDILLDGAGSEVNLNGLYLAQDHQHIDNQTFIDHASPRANSTEYYRGIMGDHGHGVFTGRVLIRRDSQKTDARQINKNLLLSPTAQADTRPQLEIFADDVKASHGATVGQLDENQIFYMRTRGIGEAAARELLTQAFAGEIVAGIQNEVVRNHVEKIVRARLA